MFFIASVSGADLNETIISEIDSNVDEEVIALEAVDNPQEEPSVNESIESEKLNSADDSEIISTTYTPKDSSEIQSYINSANDGDTIILDGYYLISSTVNVGKQLNFVGVNDATIDGNNAVRLFSVSKSGVSFKNINFKNSHSADDYDDGAVYFYGNGSVVNCSFVNNSARLGGAVYFYGNGSVVDCSFVNNSAEWFGGGAVYFNREGSVVNCSFVGNSADDGGAVYFSREGPVVNCSFVNNHGGYGGAVYKGFCVNCCFVNNHGGYGGAIAYGSVVNCSFVNNSARFGGAVYGGSVVDCSFVNNSATVDGGAVYFSREGSVVNCTFNFNSGGAVYFDGEGSVVNCTFNFNSGGAVYFGSGGSVVNCAFNFNFGGAVYFSGEGSVVNCSFVNNSDGNDGGAVYFSGEGSVVGCSFVNNSAERYGGAVYFSGDGSVVDCSFVGNSAEWFGGAVYFSVDGSVVNCSFVNNSANRRGGAVYFDSGGSVVDCSFVGNSVTIWDGGAVYFSSGGSVVNCSFVGNAADGGAVYFGSGGSVVDCSFVNNSAESGGAVYFDSGGSVVGCSFVNNSANRGGAVFYYFYGGDVVNCTFEGHGSNVLYGTSDVLDCIFDVYPTVSYHYTSFLDVSIFDRDYLMVNLSDIRGPLTNRIIKLIVNGNEYNINSSNGSASLNVNDYAPKGKMDTKVIFNYAGDDINNPVSKNITVCNPNYSSELQSYIDNANDGDTIILDGYYVFDSSTITVGKQLNFVGINNATIDGNNAVGLFSVSKSCVSFKNITFKNGNSDSGGGAIYFSSGGSVVGCSFVNNSADRGGAIFGYGDSSSIYNCSFNNCSSWGNGNAIYWMSGTNLNVSRCSFVNCSSKDGIGCFMFDNVTNYTICNCRFDIAPTDVLYYNMYYLKVNSLVMSKGEDGILTAYLFDDNDVPVTNRYVNFIVNGIQGINKTNSNGIAEFNVKDYLTESGNNSVTVSFDGDDYSVPFSVDTCVFIRYDAFLNVNNTSFIKGDDCILVINLSDSRGVLSNKLISITFNNRKYNLSTNSEGLVKLDITNKLSQPGLYSTDISFAGEELINPVSINVVVSIKYVPVLEVNDLSFALGDDSLLQINLSNSQQCLSNKNVTLTIGGKSYSAKTDLNGVVNFPISDYLTEFGDYVADVSFDGDEYNYPVSTNASVHVVRYFANLTVVQEGKYYGDTNLTFRLANSKTNESISDTPVTIVLANNTPKTLFTDVNGMVTLEVDLTPGSYYVSASASLPYVGVNMAELNFEVSKFIGEIEIMQDEDTRLLHIRAFNRYNGDVFRNFTVVLHFEPNTEFVKLITDENGCADFNIPFDEGNYSCVASITGQYMEFTPFTLENIAVNSNMNSQIIFSKNNFTFNYLESDSIYAGVIGGSLELKNIFVEGHSEAIIKLENGVITLSNLSAGNYVLHISTTPNYGYNSVPYRLDVFVSKIKSKILFAGSGIVNWGESCNLPVSVDGGWLDLENICVIGHPEANICLGGSNIVISNLSAGNYTLNVKTTPDGNHTSIEANKSITVNKVASQLTFEDNLIEFNYQGSGSVNYTVYGCSIDSKNISVENYPDAVINVTENQIVVSGLDAGEYTLRVTSTPDENHSSVTAGINVIVNKIDSDVIFGDPIVYYYGKTGSTVITLDGGIDLSSYSVDNQSNAEIDVAYVDVNKRLITVSNLPVGNYTLRVRTSPDANHNSIEKTTGITVVTVYSTVILGGNLTFPYGKSDFTTVHVEGGHVDYENISVVNHPEAEISFKSNVITVSNLTAGNYTLRVVSTPDKDHTSSVGTALIVVEKINSKITFIDDLIFEYGSEDSTYVSVDGGWIDDGNASVVGHSNANISVVNNKITVSGLDVGNYTLHVVSTPDGNHLSAENSLNFTVTKADSKVIYDKEIAFDYEKSDFTAVRVEGGTMDFNNIHIENDLGLIILTPNSNIITVSNLDVGNYILYVPTIPDSNHNSVVGRINVTVRPVASKINFTNSLVFDYLKSDFTYITVEGADLAKTNVYVDGHTEAYVVLDGNKITVSGLNPGEYTLRAITYPDSNHYSVDQNLSITVEKVSVMISAPKASVYYNSGNTWSVKLYDGKTKEALSNMKVSVKVYTGTKLYKSFTLTTNAKGIASVKVSTWTVGTHKVVVSFSKDGYKANSVTTSVTILKTPVVITAPKLSVYLKTTKKWSIKVIDSKTKKAIASTKLTLKVYTGKKYKSYSVKTNSKGVATFATSGLAVGTHKVVVSFSKTGYVSKSVASSIVVKPIPLSIKGDFSYGSSGSTVRVTVTNKLTGKSANGISVKLIVYTGSKITKSYTLVTGNYKTYKGFVGFGTNAFSVGTHKVVIKPASNMYSGQGTTSLVIKSGAANGGTYYSFVSRGKLTLA